MSAAEQPLDPIYEAAVRMGLAGYKIIRVSRRSKVPFDKDWVNLATNSAIQIDEWFGNGGDFNLGLACGMQPNGLNIVAIDIDPKNGGLETWAALVAEHGKVGGPRHTTPSGGFHLPLIFPPGFRNSRNKLGPGIDTRGEGGQILLPPSTILIEATGELVTYGAPPGRVMTATAPIEAPAWLVEALTSPPPRPPSASRHPSAQVSGDHPADWMRTHFNWEAELAGDGMIFVGALANGDQEWRRPGSSNHHSLTLHPSGAATVWSDNCPPWMQTAGWPQDNGALTINGFTYYAGKYHGGDQKAAMSHIRKEMMPPPPERADRPSTEATPEASATALAVPQLPESFWQRPVLAHIRQAAWHHLASPDATLLQVMTRYASTIHPGWLLPMKGTLDVFGVVISPSGSGKGQANKAGRALYPGPSRHPQIWMDRTISSGEGLVEGFMGPRDKDTGLREVVRQSTHFIIDEGTTLIAQLGREGATVIGTLCSAWVGEPLGQQLADGNKTRYIPPYTVRVCSTINIQNELAGQLYSDTLQATGFTGRCTFVCGQDPNMPDHAIADPGPLQLMNWSDPPMYNGRLTYPAEVHAAVRAEITGGHKGTLDRDPRQSHRILQQIKWSMILAMMDGRTDMNLEDWDLGGQIVSLSASVLAMLDAQHAYTETLSRNAKLQTRANAEAFVDDAKVDHAMRRVERWILAHVPSGAGVKQTALRKTIAGRDKPLFNEAVDNLVRAGQLLRSAEGVLTLP